ncbi:MAG: Mevalonate kinase [Bacteroidota bacterium]|nr:Mevalonate kinase [Bacteroidota bacterium]
MAKKVSHKIFHSKVLLFGEQIINKGATGLAVPWEHFFGVMRFPDEAPSPENIKSNKSLAQIADYIIHHKDLGPLYDTNYFLDDIEKGLYFDSNIPQGYGLGSSGALVAAIYHQYRKNKKKAPVMGDVKQELAEVESFFHGKSSGLDPIVCYLDKAVLIEGGQLTQAFALPKSDKAYFQIFLINTHIERKTAPFVNLFLEKCNEPKFMTTVAKSLIPANNIAVESFIQKKYAQLIKSVKIISQLHLDLLPEFIPPKFKDAWKEGLKHNEYHLKICGAGGGGFIIGIAKADANLSLLLGGMDIIELMKF